MKSNISFTISTDTNRILNLIKDLESLMNTHNVIVKDIYHEKSAGHKSDEFCDSMGPARKLIFDLLINSIDNELSTTGSTII